MVVGRQMLLGSICMLFWGEGHLGWSDLSVQVIDCTDGNNPTERESFWIEKINCYVPLGTF